MAEAGGLVLLVRIEFGEFNRFERLRGNGPAFHAQHQNAQQHADEAPHRDGIAETGCQHDQPTPFGGDACAE